MQTYRWWCVSQALRKIHWPTGWLIRAKSIIISARRHLPDFDDIVVTATAALRSHRMNKTDNEIFCLQCFLFGSDGWLKAPFFLLCSAATRKIQLRSDFPVSMNIYMCAKSGMENAAKWKQNTHDKFEQMWCYANTSINSKSIKVLRFLEYLL